MRDHNSNPGSGSLESLEKEFNAERVRLIKDIIAGENYGISIFRGNPSVRQILDGEEVEGMVVGGHSETATEMSSRTIENKGGKMVQEYMSDAIKNKPEGRFKEKDIPSILAALDAVTDMDPSLQPLGVDVAELAGKYNLPSVMVSANHAKGAEAGSLVVGQLEKEGIFKDRGDFFIGKKAGSEDRGDLFGWFRKNKLLAKENVTDQEILESYHQYLDTMKPIHTKETYENKGVWGSYDAEDTWRTMYYQLVRKIKNATGVSKDKYKIILVEDNPINFDFAKLSLSEDAVEIIHAPDYQSAQELIEKNKDSIDGVMTDLYFPDKYGSNDKSHGKEVFKKLTSDLLSEEQASMLLNDAEMFYYENRPIKHS